MASKWHDCGKNRNVWQRYACNEEVIEPVAKSTEFLGSQNLGGYRHEFGSLLEASLGRDDIGPPDEITHHRERDLILHLIAAHHGNARPHFPSRAYDHEKFSTQQNKEAAEDALRRFAVLQGRFGRWGLAWLEALVRSADQLASASPPEAHPVCRPVSQEASL